MLSDNDSSGLLNIKAESESRENINTSSLNKVPVNNVTLNINNNYSNNLSNYASVKKGLENVKSVEKIIHLKNGWKAFAAICITIVVSLLIIAGLIALGIIYSEIYFCFIPIPVFSLIVSFVFSCHFVTIYPNDALVLSYYGKYIGTVKDNGFFLLPLCSSQKTVSLKANYYNENRLKVNERDGNPVFIGVIIVWRVKDTAKVIYDVTNYHGFMTTQTESAIRYVGCKYPYEPKMEGEISLRGGHEIVNEELRQELERRVEQAGIEIEDARITEVCYASEVASMMLKKQGANSEMSAKEELVYGALDLVEKSLKEIEEKKICNFNKEEKNEYINNLMVLLSIENNSHPVINLGGSGSNN